VAGQPACFDPTFSICSLSGAALHKALGEHAASINYPLFAPIAKRKKLRTALWQHLLLRQKPFSYALIFNSHVMAKDTQTSLAHTVHLLNHRESNFMPMAKYNVSPH